MRSKPGKTYRVGILSSRTLAVARPYLDAFRHAMSGLGYLEGQNLEIVYRFAGGYDKRLPEFAAEIVREKPDVIVAGGDPAIAALKRATKSIPIVMAEIGDPVGTGMVASLARPGGNITGLTMMSTDLVGKWLQLLNELVPHLRRVAAVRDPSIPGNLSQWQEVDRVARSSRLLAFAVDVRSPDQIEAAFRTIPHVRADAILVLNDGMLSSNAARIVRLVTAQRLPAVYGLEVYGTAGGLLGLRSLGGRELEWSGDLCRPHFERCEPRRSAGRTPHDVRPDRESENRA